MMIMPPTDNRTPVVAQAFADITITLEDGSPDRWASGDLGTNFSDPDGDELSYSVGSSNESVADAVISASGPIVIVQAQGGGTTTITITARDPGGLTARQSFRVTVNDKPDHSNTPAGATAIALSESFQGRIDSPNDVDYFRLRVDSPGTLTIRTTGNADPDIAVFDGAGNEVPGVSGSWIGSITQEILGRGSALLVRFSGGNAGGEYTGSTTLDQTPQTSPDLSVGSPTVSDRGPEAGGAFTLSATVSNAGDGESAATTLRYYRSADGTITTTDTAVGTDAVGTLAASGTSAQSISLTAPATAGAYYYGACVDTVADESDATDNCSGSVKVDVEAPKYPDLEVGTPTVSDTSPEPGASFTLSAMVSNAGDEQSAATTLRYYRSTDSTISSSDTQVGTDAVGALAASGTSAESISLTAPSTAGTYYYGACVDAVTDESDTTNNCSSTVTIAVEEESTGQPDLRIVGIVAATPLDGVGPGTLIQFSASVRNYGDANSDATTLRYYRSTDATISVSDTEIGTDEVSALVPSGQVSEGIDLTAPSPAGTYYYGACVDTVAGESDTTNNCSSSVTVTVAEPEPDLVVGSPTVSDSSPTSGASFTLSATVRNAGGAASSSTTLRYYRSTDATITTADTSVGTDGVGTLAATGTSNESISLTAPSSPGTYYYGACVDTVTDESDTTNNCSSSVTVTVAEPVPNLIVDSFTITLGPTLEPDPGALVQLNQRVANVGDAASVATTVRYYRSTDAAITTSDTQVGTDAVPELAASSRFVEAHSERLPTASGTYYYGACVDAVAGESNTANNCSRSVKVTVTVPEPQPDLVVSASVDDSNLNTGDSFTLSATVSNAGDEQSAATTLRYYRSTDSTISSSDTQVGTDAVGVLAASGTSAESISLTAPSAAGTYYYGACVETVAGESDTANNCSTAVQITVLLTDMQIQGSPDLEVGTPTVSDRSPETGASFTLSATVSNAGDGESVATTLRYYRSTDGTITTSDPAVGMDAVGALGASGTSAQSISLTAPATAGTYYYGACVDAVTDESDTTNNCSSTVTIAVEEESSGQPDLRIVGVVAGTPIDGVGPGTRIQFSANIRNYGDANSDATTLRYYRSTDATISVSDTEVGTDEVSALVPSEQVVEGIDLTAPSTAGTYYYGACVDTVTGESDTTNNCSGSLAVTVPEPEPDLVVGSPTVSDSSPASGASFTLSATVRNAGGAASSSTTLRYYRSTDATITTADTSVGTDAVGALAALGTSAQSISLTAPATAGTYYYGACVDAVTDESDTTNNCSGSLTVTVPEPEPDLVVGSPTVSDSSPTSGASFTLSATVRNAGGAASSSTTLRYYRSTDATITTADASVGTDAVGALAASGTSAQSISMTAPATAGTYYYGACVDTVTDESDTTNNCSSSVTVTVAEPVPNLIVDSFTITLGPTLEPDPGALVQLNQRVANVGDAASVATTVRYYRSTDATITTSDTQVGTDAVPELAASSRFVEAHSERLPTASGTYYYGACVDAVAGESNTANNCSRSVKVTVTVPEPQPDLVVSASVDDSNLNTGDSFTLSATVSNAGDEQSAATTLRYYRSTDSTISSSDTQVGTDAVGVLAASGTSAESISLTAPSTAGTYYYGACVDAVTDESDTTNNCSSTVTIAVEEESTGQPDLRIVGIVTFTPLDGVVPGTLIQLSVNVRNYGDANSDATTLRYYRSTDATISVSDTEIGTDEVSALVPSAQVAEGIDVTAPSPAGKYYYGACVDAVTDESNTTNNCSGGLAVDVN